MTQRFLFLLLCLYSFHQRAFSADYTEKDSLKVVQLLAEGARQSPATDMVLFYAKKFIGIPYVAATLEKNETEELVVNLSQLDCTTFVETVMALTLTTWHGGQQWKDYLNWLQTLRYHKGVRKGYVSRNHYFSQWIMSNEHLGLVRECKGTAQGTVAPFSAKQVLDLSYMSTWPEKYPMLKGRVKEITEIRRMEQMCNGKEIFYIPKEKLNVHSDRLPEIQNGDILAIVTAKKGLDVSHVGFAVWDENGKLHLLNASSLHGKVVLEPMTLYEYLCRQSSRLGLRVIRPVCPEKRI